MFVYDIEIKRGIAPADPSERKAGIEYCNGWTDYSAMGIACIGVWDYMTDSPRVFGENELQDFQKFIDRHDVAVGFNNIRFDNNVLQAHGVVIQPSKSFDILFQIYRVLGSYQKGCRLENVVKANFPNHPGKSGNGAAAPELWQTGFYTRVIDYCLNDVRLTKMLTDKIIRNGFLLSPINPSQKIHIKRP